MPPRSPRTRRCAPAPARCCNAIPDYLSRTYTWGELNRVFAEADRVVSRRFRWNRVGANPTENNALAQAYTLTGNELLLIDATGSRRLPRASKDSLAAELVTEIATRLPVVS